MIGTQSLAMMITSGVVGGLSGSGKINMKWVLIGGLLLFAAGMVYVVSVAEPDSGQWAFVPGLVAAGIGLGCVWVPVFGLATRDMPPSRAGIGAGCAGHRAGVRRCARHRRARRVAGQPADRGDGRTGAGGGRRAAARRRRHRSSTG